ncbi:sphingosine-1-phosphate lyase 1-like [Oratosquilla oratoria]|uniref:sphingosine-1-phosphate lyase 1-like n=1 Tax=Oratosquilla oratoria TaxID=337810 RepID=UPI003F7630F3
MALQMKGVSEVFQELLQDVEAYVEERLQVYQPWMLVAGTVLGTIALLRARDLYVNRQKLLTELKKRVFRFIRTLPGVRQRIQRELAAAKDDLEKDFFKNGSSNFNELPVKGWSVEKVLQASKAILSESPYAWQEGRISAGTYAGADDAHTEVLEKVYHQAAWANPLHADIFPGVRKMEAEIVRMTINTFRGGDSVCGCLTSGGSESILMALKAYRDWARNINGISEPNIVAGVSIHAGFDKAAILLNIRLIKVRLNPTTLQVDVRAMRNAMDSNTIALACSAPEYAHGIVDDIEAVGALGASKGVGVHVDCCMGGYLLPFMEKAGFPIAPFDFTVKGVTSISADTHKYGSSPKGSSVIMYTDAQLRRHQYFVTPDWPGGIYASPTIPGSRPGGLVAVCWASLLYHGVEGYVQKTKEIITTARNIKQGLSEIPEVYLFGDPQASILAIGSDVLNIYSVLEVLTTKGWHLMAIQNPPGLMVCVTSLQCQEGLVEALLRDMKDAVRFVRDHPSAPPGQIGKVYGAAASIPDKELVSDCAKLFLDAYYQTGHSEIPREQEEREIEEPLCSKEDGNVEVSGTTQCKDEVKEEDVTGIVKQIEQVLMHEEPVKVQEKTEEKEGPEKGEAILNNEMTVGENVTGDVAAEDEMISDRVLEKSANVDVKGKLLEKVREDPSRGAEERNVEEVVKKEEILEEPAKEDSAKEEPAKEDSAKEEPAKEDSAKEEPAKEDSAKEEPAKEDSAKEEPAKEESAKEEVANGEQSKEEVVKEGLMEEIAKEEVVKEELAKEELAKEEVVKEELVKEEVSKDEEEEIVKEDGHGCMPKPASIAA